MEKLVIDLSGALDYVEYRALVHELVQAGKASWDEAITYTPEYTKLNEQRMNRLDKTVKLEPALIAALEALPGKYLWRVLTEPWCGDAAQSIPVMEIASKVNKNVQIEYLLRDKHPELMQQYLTNGGKSIPKLICYNAETMEPMWHWGPRPTELQAMVMQMNKENVLPFEERAERLHKWYAVDKTKSIQAELLALIAGK
ncbi:thioredoxin-like protein [Chitinophaga skermanii]|uniref:Thioredoxin-like protein n=1 Tax=Chitinophaga skermanii TaxID=331697 RepID=A0A327QRE2_9BACT|nr:thioredoxin family protein [Chitinophaga skermanii]RAJ06811.1 thioredoxin-like protein [Chitinophaga skermanii]